MSELKVFGDAGKDAYYVIVDPVGNTARLPLSSIARTETTKIGEMRKRFKFTLKDGTEMQGNCVFGKLLVRHGFASFRQVELKR